MWTSKTTQLFFEVVNSRRDDEKWQNNLYLEHIKNQITSLIIETLGLSISSSSSTAEQLDDILQGAIDLDERFRQAARREYQAERFPSDEKAEVQKAVQFVISRALIKRGDSDGANDGLEATVMEMKVSCKNT
ncbi:hypothetical protein FDENT_1436 [Fusarium denticulatum]|uniref:Uncharacterized protein n=1 Tax=Fusarium denticulatum TaxID=48507 RepID=A0A8H5XI45_9HYPO|nr:hypothetical protein FDENT_1436 [Fusarium denticulatum]